MMVPPMQPDPIITPRLIATDSHQAIHAFRLADARRGMLEGHIT
jgi:hypothetical protein